MKIKSPAFAIYKEKMVRNFSNNMMLLVNDSPPLPHVWMYASDWRKCSLLLGQFQVVQIVIDDSERAFHPDPSLSRSINYIYSMQIIHPRTDLINGLVAHYIHVFYFLSIAHCVSLQQSLPGILLTPGGERFMMFPAPWTASEFMKPV